jgi:hypothetical protein
MEKQLLGPVPCSPGNSIAANNPVLCVHKSYIGIVALNHMGYDSMARFILEVTLNWRGMHVR